MAIKNTKLGGTDFVNGNIPPALDWNDTFDATVDRGAYGGALGEVKMFALSVSGAVTKATLQGKGWAICDGTTPASQGISSADITASVPDLQEKFIQMSNDETSGTTGGSTTHNHTTFPGSGSGERIMRGGSTTSGVIRSSYNSGGSQTNLASYGDAIRGPLYTNKIDGRPPFYELAFFIKVKTIY